MLRVLVLTGGHPFDRPSFTDMLDALPDVWWEEVAHPEAQALHAGDELGRGSRQERGLAGSEGHARQVVGQYHIGADAPRCEPRLGLRVRDLLPPHVG